MVRISGGDGSSIDKAIVISDCDHMEGIDQEYREIRRKFGFYKLIEQSLLDVKGRKYDRLILEIDGPQTIEIYFDISEIFGKGFEF
ncbi:MAG: hypothetical protein ACFFBP_21395 [Promethearchaeota archaeon]